MMHHKTLSLFFMILSATFSIHSAEDFSRLLQCVTKDGYRAGIYQISETEATCKIKNLAAREIIWEVTRTYNPETNSFDNIEFEETAGVPTELAKNLFEASTGYFSGQMPDLS